MGIMVKGVSAVGIILICTYLGLSQSNRLKKRTVMLRQIIAFLQYIEVEIKYNLTSIPEIIQKGLNNMNEPLKTLLVKLNKAIKNNNLLEEDEKAISKCINETDILLAEDKRVLIDIFNNLGKSDMDNQMSHIAGAIKMLELEINEADVNFMKLGKMYKTIGVLSGLMIVIVII